MNYASFQKKKKTIIWIVVSLVAVILIGGGIGLYYWKKSKKSSPSSPTENNPPIDEKELENWNPYGYSNYQIFPLVPDTPVAEFKKDLLKLIYEHSDKSESISEIEQVLLKLDTRMDHQSDQKLKKVNPNFQDTIEFWMKINEKYPEDIFHKLPASQDKFISGIEKSRKRQFYLSYASQLKHKANGEIDWVASHKLFSESSPDRKRKSKKEEYQEVFDYIKKLNITVLFERGKEFENLTNLTELNQWVNRASSDLSIMEDFLLKLLWERGKAVGKKIYHSKTPRGAKAENKILNLTWPVLIYEPKEK